MEIYENGLPLAYAIRNYIPKEIDIVMFRERISSVKLDDFGSSGIQNYAKYITETYLINK